MNNLNNLARGLVGPLSRTHTHFQMLGTHATCTLHVPPYPQLPDEMTCQVLSQEKGGNQVSESRG